MTKDSGGVSGYGVGWEEKLAFVQAGSSDDRERSDLDGQLGERRHDK